jgi:uncharacterized repeat protein (TIGR01451 family)
MPGGIAIARGRLRRAALSVLALALAWCFAAPAFAALDVSMSIAPTFANPIFPGDVTAFRITITNSDSAGPVTAVGFTDNLPAGLQVSGTGVVNYACVAGDGSAAATAGTVTATVGSGAIVLAGGSIPAAMMSGASGKCDIDVDVTSNVRNSVQTNTIHTGDVTGTDAGANPISNGSQAVQTVTVNNLNLPTISKHFSAASVTRNGQVVTLTMVIDNSANATVNLPLNGGGDTPPFALQDILPTGLQVAATPNASAGCGISFAPAAGDTTLMALGGTAPAGGTCTLKVDLQATTAGAAAFSTAVVNTIHAATDFGNKRGLIPLADATASLALQSALQVSQVFTPGTVAAGQTATLKITLKNASLGSDITLDGAQPFTDTRIGVPSVMGSGTLTLTADPTLAGCGAGVAARLGGNLGFTLTGGTITAGASCVITVTYIGALTAAGTPAAFTDTIVEGAIKTTDATLVSEPSAASVNVVDQLTVTKSVAPTTAGAGEPVKYTVTINNFAAASLANVKVTDTLPVGLTFLPTSPAAPALGGPCTGLTQDPSGTATVPVFKIAVFPAGAGASPATCTITFYAQSPQGAAPGAVIPANTIAGGGITGTVSSGGNTGNVITNAGGSGSGPVTVGSTLTNNKAFNPASAFEGTVSQLTVTFTNLSAQPITAMSFTDNLPIGDTASQLVVANPAAASTTCVGGVVTATAGAASVSMTGATVPARAANGTGANGICTLTVSVVGAAGHYTNNLPAAATQGTETYADATTHAAASPGVISATINYSSALTAAKSFSPSTVSSGGMSTVTITLGNVGTGTLNSVGVIDPLPAGMTVANPANGQTTCGGSPAITATPAASSATLSGATIPGAGQCTFQFNVVAVGAGNWINTIPSGNVSAAGGVHNVSPVTATLTNSSAGGVSVTNNASPNSLTSPGQVSVLTLTLTNGGTVDLSGLNLTDFYTSDGTAGGTQTGMVNAAAPGATTTCPGGVATASPNGTSVTLTGASIVHGTACTVTVNVTLITTGTIQNKVPASAITDSQGISNTLPTTTSLSASANIGVTKRFTPTVIKPAARSRLEITLINPTAQALSNVTATDNLPAGLVVASPPNPSTTCTGATVTGAAGAGTVGVTGASLPAAIGGVSAICVADIDVTAAAAGTYNNTIAIGGVTAVLGGNPVSNPVPAPATLEVRSPVVIAKAFNANSVALGASSTLTITLTNPNTVALTGAALLDSLPANVTVALTPNASTTCAGGVVTAPVSATSVQLTGGTIPASGACTIKVDVLSNVAGTYLNTIPAGALATNQGVTNESPASDTLKIINPPSVSKQFSPTSIPSGGTSTLTILLGNTNATAATLTADFIDTLPTSPAPIVIAAIPALTGSCTLGSATATAGGATVKYASGASIPAGGCTIIVNVTGVTNGVYTNIIPLGALQTNDGNNPQPANASLTISPLGFISGTVFKDNNVTPNGTFEIAIDTPIAGVTINLTGTDFGANGVAGGGDDTPVSQTTLTDALGNYAFTGLNPGAYSVTEPTQPAGTNNGITTAGAVGGGGGGTAGTATGIATTPSVIGNITLLKSGAAVATSPGNNFAEVAPSTISGLVFLDQDNNGVQNAADTVISGVTIQLLQGAAVVATTVTDGSGAYSFSGLAPGTYTLREPTQPPGTANGQTLAGSVGNGGTVGTPTGAGVTPSQIAGLILPPGTTSPNNNFAEVPAGRQVSGRVFTDFNADGIFNGTDTGLGGVALNLTGNDFNGLPVTATTATTSDGRYVFTGLPESSAGGYTVTEPNQPGGTLNGITTAGSTGGLATLVAVTPSAISGIDLRTTNTISANNNFGEGNLPAGPPPVATLAGHVYVDANNNGVLETSEIGVAGVTVTLTGTSSTGTSVSLTTVTAADGTYSFTGMPPSNAAGYVITETQPAAFTDGKTTVPAGEPGSSSASKPVGSGGPDVIGGVAVSSGSNLSGYNFGELPPGGQLSGFVYVDLNDNGVKDAGESGIPGVTVRLIGKDANGGNVDILQITGADGAYSFVGVPVSGLAGYSLTETQPTAYLDGKTTFPQGNPGIANAPKPVAANAGDSIVTVVVHQNDNFKDYDFGEKGDGSIAGFVYQDPNNNGVKDSGEPGIGGVSVRLTGTDTNGLAVDRTVLTGADGAYLFSGLVQSNAAGYILTETQPASFADGKDSLKAGNPGSATSTKPVAAGGPDVIGAVVLQPHGALTDYDFGEGKSSSSIAGYVYIDANNNGVRDGGEAAIPGVTVRLTGTDFNGIAISLSQVTDASGAFLFSVTPSNGAGYTLTEFQPSGFNDGKTTLLAANPGSAVSHKPVSVGDQDTVSGIVLPVGAALTDYRFGELNVPQLKPPIVNGYVYLDRNHTRVRPTDGTEAGQAGWTVVLRQNGTTICTTTTDATGFYQFDNLHCAGYEVSGLPIGSGFSITFSKDGDSLPNIPTSGGDRGQVPSTGGQILNITLGPADQVVEQNLPLDPSGVVYNSVTRTPVAGALVHIAGPAGFDVTTQLVGGVMAANQTVGSDGLYQFLLQNNFPSGVYTLTVTAPTGFVPAPSTSLPPCSNTLTVGLAVNPALIQATDTAPGLGVTPQANVAACPGLVPGGATTTQYFLTFVITNGGSAPILNNHIPLDPILGGALSVTKTTPMVTVSRGALVPYTITATNTLPALLAGVSIKDQFPAGFKFRDGTATENGKPVKPVVTGQFITWPTETFAAKQKNSYTVMLVVGSGVGDGDYVNHAFVAGPTGAPISNTAAATVRIVPDPTFDCPDIIGKVFDDKNANGYQDDGEPGIPGVRMATPRGLLITSDAEGRFHVPCPLIPNPDRGSNFVMKLDERSLPSGFRLTTENPRDVRVTRGKLTKLNFGATIHRVVRVELASAAFTAGGTDLLADWKAQIDALPGKLADRPSVVRIAYARGEDTPDLANRRAEAVRKLIDQAWRGAKGRYTLIIEIEGAEK